MNRTLRLLRTSVVTAAVAAGLCATAAQPASALDWPWVWSDANGKVAEGAYVDVGNKLRVADLRKDGHSAVLLVWRPSEPEHSMGCWDTGGADDTAQQCVPPSGYFKEDEQLYARLCTGEWSTRTVLRCGSKTWSFRL